MIIGYPSLLKGGIHPKIVSERLDYASIGIIRDSYNWVLPGLGERAIKHFDGMPESMVIAEEAKIC